MNGFCLVLFLIEIRYHESEHVNGYVGFQINFFLNKATYNLSLVIIMSFPFES